MMTGRFVVCALIIVIATILAASSYYYVGASPNASIDFGHLQNKSKSPPSPSPAAKTISSLLVRPPFRISETPTAFADRRPGRADVVFNPDDNEYLVVWASDGLTEVNGVNDVYGERISAATNERIGIAFRISSMSDSDKYHSSNDPRVVYNRTAGEYLVIWNGSGQLNSPDNFFEISGQRVSRAGKNVGSPFQISHNTDLGKVNTNFVRSSNQADVAWNSVNNEYLVIWKGMGEPDDVVKMEIYGQRLKASGELLGKYFRISHTTDQGPNFHANTPAIAYDSHDNQYLVAWSGGFKNESKVEVWGMGLNASGQPIGQKNDFRISQVTADVGPDRRASVPRVVYNSVNNEYFVVFQVSTRGEGSGDEIFGRRIDAATLDGSKDLRISDTTGTGSKATRPVVIFNSIAKEYLVLWRNTRQSAPAEISGQRISLTGSEIESDFQISNIESIGKDRSVNSATLTNNTTNGEYFVIWQGNGLPGANTAKITEIFGQRIPPPNKSN
jgi:hypothetical protein